MDLREVEHSRIGVEHQIMEQFKMNLFNNQLNILS